MKTKMNLAEQLAFGSAVHEAMAAIKEDARVPQLVALFMASPERCKVTVLATLELHANIPKAPA